MQNNLNWITTVGLFIKIDYRSAMRKILEMLQGPDRGIINENLP
jgi:hypothetical protein